MGKKLLTLDIGASRVALAAYEQTGRDSLTLVNYGIAKLAAPLDAGSADTILAPAIGEIMREKGIKPGPVAVSVSGQMVFPRFAAIPMAGGQDKFEQMIRYEIEQNIPFPIDEMVCDRQVLGDTPDGDKSVMIVAAKVDQVEAITGALTGMGFTPELVDVAPIAVTNAVRYVTGDDGSCSIILDIGAKTTSLVIAEGDRLYNRTIPIGGNNINRDIGQALGIGPEDAELKKLEKGYVSQGGVVEDEDAEADRISKVCRAVLTRLHAEISRSVNFYRSQQGGSAPVRMYLTGGTALLPQVDEFFSENLGIEVAAWTPASSAPTPPCWRPAPAWPCTRCMRPGSTSISFRRPSSKPVRKRPRFRWWRPAAPCWWRRSCACSWARGSVRMRPPNSSKRWRPRSTATKVSKPRSKPARRRWTRPKPKPSSSVASSTSANAPCCACGRWRKPSGPCPACGSKSGSPAKTARRSSPSAAGRTS